RTQPVILASKEQIHPGSSLTIQTLPVKKDAMQDSMMNVKEEIDDEEIKKTLELAHAYKTFEELKGQEGLMDFPNLLSATLKLFRERKNVLKQYQKQFKFVLIDEFQDTNYAQNQLAVMLAG